MAYRILAFDFTVPAGTPKAAPITMGTPLGVFNVSGLEISVPTGPNGNLGIRFSSGGAQMIPYNAGSWLILSGENVPWPLSGQITSGAWQVQGYNTGKFDHTVHIRYLLDLITATASSIDLPLLPAAAIMGELSGQTAGAGVEA